MVNKKIKMKGFTLVELLAVIVILAIILVIAVPKIMDTIKDATKASLESSAKMVASQVENQYTVAQTLGKEFGDTGNCMEEWAGLNETDYASCRYEITNNGEAKVTIGGKGKFNGLSVCNATRSNATAIEGECPLACNDNEVLVEGTCVKATNEACFEFASDTGTILKYYLYENNDDTQEICPLDVVIPSKINNVIVTTIGSNAFGNLGITSVKIPNTVITIESSAFRLNQLTEISIPNSVTKIGLGAFEWNPLTSIKLNNLDTDISSCPFGIISEMEDLEHNLPESYDESGCPQ